MPRICDCLDRSVLRLRKEQTTRCTQEVPRFLTAWLGPLLLQALVVVDVGDLRGVVLAVALVHGMEPHTHLVTSDPGKKEKT